MATSALALQWSLEATTAEAFGVLKDVLQAATTDNVQPIALIAAEAFGATLPMAEQSRLIVEKAASRRGASVLLEHLKIQIGWSKNDSTTWLSRSDAGVRFLGLATALLTMGSVFDAARCLDRLIRESAPTGATLPTLGQLRDLLKAVRPKLSGIGFEDKVLGAAKLVQAVISEAAAPIPPIWFRWRQFYTDCPGFEHLITLVDALKRFGRVGEIRQVSDPARMTVTTAKCYCWLYAFISWVMGEPPNISSRSAEEDMELNSSSNICLIYDSSLRDEDGTTMSIAIYELLEQPSHLWLPHSRTTATCGEVSLRTFGQHVLFRSLAFYSIKEEGYFQALSWILHLLTRLDIWGSHDTGPGAHSLWPGIPLEKAFTQVLQLVFGDPAVSSFMNFDLSKWSNFADCQSSLKFSGEFESFVVASSLSILSLSFFDILSLQSLTVPVQDGALEILDVVPGEGVSETLDVMRGDLTRELLEFVSNTSGGFQVSPQKLLAQIFKTTGCDHHYETVASMSHGHVIYLSQLSLPRIHKGGMLGLSASPGRIHYKNEIFATIESTTTNKGSFKLIATEVLKPENFCSSWELQWEVMRNEQRLLLSMGLDEATMQHGRAGLIPRQSPRTCYLLPCTHDLRAALAESDPGATFVHPSWLIRQPDGALWGPPNVYVVAVDNNEEHRFFAYACATQNPYLTMEGVVFRGKACLACSLDYCRKQGYSVLIL